MSRSRRLNVFPSFGGDAEPYAGHILASYTGGRTDSINLFNWTGTNAILPGESLDDELRKLIDNADVFLGMVDGRYGDPERRTRLELSHALALRKQRGGGLRIVLFLLDLAAPLVLKTWEGHGADFLSEVACERFFDSVTGEFLVPREHLKLHARLVDLRNSHLAGFKGQDTDRKPPSSASLLSGVVLLERAVVPEDADALPPPTPAALEVERELREAGAEVRHVPAGWADLRRLDLDAPNAAPLADAAFVQVLAERGAEQAAANPDKLGARLRAVELGPLLPRSRLVQWHPAGGARSATFDALAKAGGAPEVVFRDDAPADLARWLKGIVRLGDGQKGPVAAYHDVDDAHRAALVREIERLTRDVLPEDPDERELHTFSSNGFSNLVSRLAGRRPILVVHNINQSSPIGKPQDVRKQTIAFFKDLAQRADDVLQRQQAGPEDVFWLAVLMAGNTIDSGGLRLPLPDPHLYRWRVLTCEQRAGNELVLEGGPRFADIARDLKGWAEREAGAPHA